MANYVSSPILILSSSHIISIFLTDENIEVQSS